MILVITLGQKASSHCRNCHMKKNRIRIEIDFDYSEFTVQCSITYDIIVQSVRYKIRCRPYTTPVDVIRRGLASEDPESVEISSSGSVGFLEVQHEDVFPKRTFTSL